MDNHPRGIVIESSAFLVSAVSEILGSRKIRATRGPTVDSKTIYYRLWHDNSVGPALFSTSLTANSEADGHPPTIVLEQLNFSAAELALIAQNLIETYHLSQLIMLV